MIYKINNNGSASNSGTDTGEISLPTSAYGDLLLLIVAHRSGTAVTTVSTPAGWTLLDSQNRTTSVGLWLFYKYSANGDTAPTCNFLDNGGSPVTVGCFQADIINLRGMDLTSAVQTTRAKSSGANGNVTFGAFTADAAPVVAVAVGARAYASAHTNPTGYTSWFSNYAGTTSSGVGYRISGLLDADTTIASASGTNTYAWASIHFALTPRAAWSSGNGVLFLDATDDRIQIASAQGGSQGTVEFWARAAGRASGTDSGYGRLCSVQDGTNGVVVDCNGINLRVTGNSTAVTETALNPLGVPPGAWFHCAIVWSGGTLNVYVNPTPTSSAVFSSSATLDVLSATADPWLGSATAGPATEFDRIRVYHDPRTLTELYNNRYTTSPSGDYLAGAYNWDDSTAPVMGEHWAGGAPIGIVAEKATFTISMKAAAFQYARSLAADPASFVITGNEVTFTYVPSRRDLTMAAEVASFLLAGQDVILRAGRVLPSEAGAFTLAGQDVILRAGRVLPSEVGAFTLTGQDAILRAGWKLPAAVGEFTVTGQDAALRAARVLLADVAAFTVTGQDAVLTFTPIVGSTYTLEAATGAFAVTGNDALLRIARSMAAGAGVFEVNGNDATLRRALRLAADAGAFTITGADAALARHYLLAAAPGEFAVTGQDISFAYARRLFAEVGRITVTGYPATLVYTPMVPGSLVLVLDARITKRLMLDAEITKQILLDAEITDRIMVESHV